MNHLHLIALWFCIFSGCGRWNDAEPLPNKEETEEAEELIEIPEHVRVIREARSAIAPIDVSLLRKTTEQYNLEVKAGHWPEWAAQCLSYRHEFEQAEELTLYPVALIAGFAMHESGGCDMSASDWAGGKGFMQLTHISQRRHVDPIAKMLGVKRKEVNYQTDPLHNILVGIAVLDDYERRLGSRPHGILAYNMGVGGVKRTVRRMGRSTSSLPTIIEMKPHLVYNGAMKPRVYVQKILAATIMMDLALQGEDITRKKGGLFTPDDIPGWNPASDGETLLTTN